MKFSKSGILAISGMLVANSFLLMATTYAATSKEIKVDPNHAEQTINTVYFSDGKDTRTCSLVLFDVSGSMLVKKGNDYITGTKRENAVAGAIQYSELLLQQDPNTRVGLILFGTKDDGKNLSKWYVHPLGRTSFEYDEFKWDASHRGATHLGGGLRRAGIVFTSYDNECKNKNVVIMSDGEPNEKNSNHPYTTEANKLKARGIRIYSIGYETKPDLGDKTLGGISAGGFYKADGNNISDIFSKIAGENRLPLMEERDKKLRIISDNFIISSTGTENGNQDIYNEIENSSLSNILGGKGNSISASSTLTTIIAGIKNYIQTSEYSTILGGNSNGIITSSYYSTIIGGLKNKIEGGNNTTIAGGKENTVYGNFSTIAGNNNIISGNNSLSMGIQSNIEGDNSFYWSDRYHNNKLIESNVFAVVSDKGMAINTDTPHDLAQLTISGTLIVRENNKDINVQCGGGEGKGILKTIKKGAEKCLCSCDGERRRSLYNGSCESSCNPDIKPACGNVKLQHIDSTHMMYSGGCNTGNAIATSYYVTSNNIVNWACQTHDGTTIKCTGDILN